MKTIIAIIIALVLNCSNQIDKNNKQFDLLVTLIMLDDITAYRPLELKNTSWSTKDGSCRDHFDIDIKNDTIGFFTFTTYTGNTSNNCKYRFYLKRSYFNKWSVNNNQICMKNYKCANYQIKDNILTLDGIEYKKQ